MSSHSIIYKRMARLSWTRQLVNTKPCILTIKYYKTLQQQVRWHAHPHAVLSLQWLL